MDMELLDVAQEEAAQVQAEVWEPHHQPPQDRAQMPSRKYL